VEELSAELHAAERFLTDDIEQAETRIARIQDRAERLRLVPASAIFPILERAVRDAAESVRKPVRFVSAGGDHRLDAYVLRILRDALLHVVRNGVAHGIEPEAGRAAAGKPREGTIQVSVERRGSRLAIVCSDDGCGIDVEAVRAAAVRQGVLAPAAAARVGLQEAVQLLLRGGLTTTGAVTELSGRGIGLDVLRDAVARLKGELFVRSDRGRGTAIEVVVPVSVSSQAVLQVDAGGVCVALPLDAVVSNVLLRPEDVVRSADRDAIRHGGALIPLTPLSGLLSRPAPAPTGSFSAVIVRAGGEEAAIRVDRLGEVTRVMVRPIPASAQADPVVLGACLDAGGTPQLVLDPRSVIDGARRAAPSATPEATREGSPILIIDDSLTTRMLEQSILESAGYEVALATSAEEGLEKARQSPYALFLVDVEMPGIDGFTFIERTRREPALASSRSEPEDLARGAQVGASGYIVKGRFDQRELLGLIERLVEA
jgi:two-component system chemotaxis sensor kinase CheA